MYGYEKEKDECLFAFYNLYVALNTRDKKAMNLSFFGSFLKPPPIP